MRRQAKHQLLIALFFMPFALAAQTASDPRLHHRGDPSTIDHPVVIKQGKSNSIIPEDASGEYMLGKPGEVVEIILQFGELSGYISRQGDGYSDEGTPLTFFFEQTSLHDQELGFTTRQVHGIWYSFKGTILRGTGKTRDENGYYVLMGDLIEHDAVHKTESRRSVALKSGQQPG
ncbi:MAG TPA: hypothetical protein VHT24_08280 [Pseudacidobacterium sp.]|jgi:hypothetical protein|nr:hypothetical protein [Pseudacidobacterium sp.]